MGLDLALRDPEGRGGANTQSDFSPRQQYASAISYWKLLAAVVGAEDHGLHSVFLTLARFHS